MPDIQVTIPQGELKGKLVTTESKFEYLSFQGIPYAKPPIGDLRFQNPQPAEKWDGILDATQVRNSCAQFDPLLIGKFYGEEDCLYLNVYIPSKNKKGEDNEDTKYAVMVWIHGGGFVIGSGDPNIYGPDYLVEKNVIIVTLNYRLGVLGFSCFHTPDIPGNAGLKDQSMALKWVKQNIEYFGGDPNNITIFGESAGAASVQYQMLSPMSEGLFHRAILQSGSSNCLWACQKNPEEILFVIAKELGLETKNKVEVIKLLKTTPVQDLIMSSFAPSLIGHITLSFGPTVERAHKNVEPFIMETPETLMKTGRFNKVSTITGLNTNEGVIYLSPSFTDPKTMKLLQNNEIPDLLKLFPSNIVENAEPQEMQRMLNKVKQFYFTKGKDVTQGYIDIISDVCFIKDGVWSAEKFSQYCPPAYFYLFSYRGSRNFLNVVCNMSYEQASHMDELGYMFHVTLKDAHKIPLTEEDALVMSRMVQMWTDFAKYGNPTPRIMDVIPTRWEPITLFKTNLLKIDKDLEIVENPLAGGIKFWNDLIKTHIEENNGTHKTIKLNKL